MSVVDVYLWLFRPLQVYWPGLQSITPTHWHTRASAARVRQINVTPHGTNLFASTALIV